MKPAKCIVIGANGYIGRHVARILSGEGHDVSAFDIQDASQTAGTSYKQIDITDRAKVGRADLSCDFIFLMAGMTGTYNGFENYEEYVKVNEIGMLNVLDGVRKYPEKPRIVFPSSRLVYKGKDGPIKEEDEKEGKTIYAINKLTCENILKTYEAVFKIPYTVLRICVPYGNLFDDKYSFGTIGSLLKNAKSGWPIVLYGDGSMKRTFTHIEDICEQVSSAGMHPQASNITYNVKGEPFSLSEVVSLFAKKYNVEVKFLPWPENDLLIESGHTVFDSGKIDKLLNRPLKHKLESWI